MSALIGTRAGWRANIWGELVAEFIGTATLIAFGDGVVAMAVAALNQSGRGTEIFQASGDWLLITWGWAIAVTMAIYVAGGISGAHINPAVTLAVAVRGMFPWAKVVPYWIAQVLGAFVGAWLVYWIYGNAIGSYEAANHIVRGTAASLPTFSIFATFGAPYFHGSLVGPFFDQVVGTFFLIVFVLAIIDKVNLGAEANLWPFIVGLAVAAIGMSYGANAGYAINPARDFGPRLFAFFAGWGSVALPGANDYFVVPIVGPLLGGVIGALFYEYLIARVLTARREAAGPEPAAAIEPGQYDEEQEHHAPAGA